MLSKIASKASGLVLLASIGAQVVAALDNGLAITPQMGWVREPCYGLLEFLFCSCDRTEHLEFLWL